MPRADPKRPASGFDNFVEISTGFAAADTGEEDCTHRALFFVTPSLRLYLHCSCCLRGSIATKVHGELRWMIDRILYHDE